MREIELKILLDDETEKRLRANPALTAMGSGKPRTQSLRSIYYDTVNGDLREAGIALRLRRKGRSWVQTVKKSTAAIEGGLAQPIEDEISVRGQTFALERIADDDLREEVIGIVRTGIAPVAETVMRRTIHDLEDDGAVVEFAIDRGEVKADEKSAPLVEAELELKDGAPADLFRIAARLFPTGPVRFSNRSKSARAHALAEGGPAIEPLIFRKAAPVSLERGQTTEEAAQLVLAECLGHALANIPPAVETDDPAGPHQIRVGLRRFRSALAAFRPSLGRAAVAPIAGTARAIGAEVGQLRDLDVLLSDLVRPMAERTPAEPGFAPLAEAIERRRAETAEGVRSWLAGPDVTRFVFEARGWLAGRGWLDPADHDQTRRLAAPVETLAARQIAKRWKAVRAYGRRIGDLSVPERHEMRKEIKQLRYVAEVFRTLYDEDAFKTFRRALKRVQTGLGALNDSAMAESYLTDPDAPGADDPSAQRAAGRLIGATQAEADRLWPETMKEWRALTRCPKFWR